MGMRSAAAGGVGLCTVLGVRRQAGVEVGRTGPTPKPGIMDPAVVVCSSLKSQLFPSMVTP